MNQPPDGSPRQALLTALAGITAHQAGMVGEVLALGEESPGRAFSAAVAIAARLMDEVRDLGGDPDELMRRIYRKAYHFAPS